MRIVRAILRKSGAREGGFSLMEMIIVLAVLGVLSAIVISNARGFFAGGGVVSQESGRRTVQRGVEAYYTETLLVSGKYLREVPQSASGEKAGGTWYLDSRGIVQYLEGGAVPTPTSTPTSTLTLTPTATPSR